MNIHPSLKSSIFTTAEGLQKGYTRQHLAEAVERKVLDRVCRGVYCIRGVEMSEFFSEQLCALKYPHGVVCLLSALRFHGLTTQNSPDVWLAVKNHVRIRTLEGPSLCLTMMSDEAYSYGIEEHDVQGVKVRVYSPAKTVADCFKYRSKVGKDVAIESLREGIRTKKFTVREVMKAAEICRVVRILEPYLEGILA